MRWIFTQIHRKEWTFVMIGRRKNFLQVIKKQNVRTFLVGTWNLQDLTRITANALIHSFQ